MNNSEKAWDISIAEQFKKRNNPTPLGAVLGKILKPLPNISIELLNGNAVIDSDKIYLSNAITNRLAIECTMKEFESTENSYENLEMSRNDISSLNSTGSAPPVISMHDGSIDTITSSVGNNAKENKVKGKFILQTVFHLKPGMFVLVIPNFEEDKFFVVDVFNYAPEVSLEWEYYQK